MVHSESLRKAATVDGKPYAYVNACLDSAVSLMGLDKIIIT